MQLVPPGKREEEGSTSSSSFYPFSSVPPFHPGRLCLARSPFAAAAAPPSPAVFRPPGAPLLPCEGVCATATAEGDAHCRPPPKKEEGAKKGNFIARKRGREEGGDTRVGLPPLAAARTGCQGGGEMACFAEGGGGREPSLQELCTGDTRGGGKRKGGRRSRRTRLQRYSSPRLSVLFTFYFICFFFVAVTLHKSGVHLISYC